MDWFAYIDSYCERLQPGFWAEPLNFLSNAAFFLAGFFAWRLTRSWPPGLRARRWDVRWLITLIFAVAIGSSLFHSLAVYWSMLADVIPIGIFLLFYLGSFLKYMVGLRWQGVVLGYVAFVLATLAFSLGIDPAAVNGSQQYFSSLLALALMAYYLWRRRHRAASYFGWAAVGFALSLTFRSIDMAICPSFAYGTHFLWHALNGTVIYLVMKPLIQDATSRL